MTRTFEQASFADLGTPLHEVTFVVVDLETTGGSASTNSITEIGAVKVRGGEVLGEFQTLVRPDQPIPAYITVLTGISESMVATAPRIGEVLPAFLEFARGTVLVAHNAKFDVGFLQEACRRLELNWPTFQVLDTVLLARRILARGETRNHKLSTLATYFGVENVPDHRALHDARATVEVLHGLLARVGNLGVHSLEELQSYSTRVPEHQRRKRYLADGLPSEPGVYVFKDNQERVLYVGTSVDIRRRVRQYFTASEQRSRMSQMVQLADHVTPIVCQSPLEASVRELRLIAEHKPRFNRRSRDPERAMWVKLTNEAFPRLSVVRSVRDDGASYVGPFGRRAQAEAAVAAVHEVFPLRQCTDRLSTTSNRKACALLELGRCGGPCIGAQSQEDYAQVVTQVRAALDGDCRASTERLESRMAVLAGQERFEDAGQLRDRMLALIRAAARAQRITPLSATPELVAARRVAAGGWEVVTIRHGRLAGTLVTPRGADPMPYIAAMRAAAESVAPMTAPEPAAVPEETEKLLAWLESPGVRVVDLVGEWSCPVHGAGAQRARFEPIVRSFAQPLDFPPRPLPSATRLAG